MKKLKDYIVGKVRALDPKLVTAGAAYLLTLLVTKVIAPDVLHVNPEHVLNDVLIPGYLRVDQAIALAAGAIGGYWKANDGTVLRSEQEDGNAELPPA